MPNTNSPIHTPDATEHFRYHNAMWYGVLTQLAGASISRFSCLCPDGGSPYGVIEERKNDYVRLYVQALMAGADPAVIPVKVCDCGDFINYCCGDDITAWLTDNGLDPVGSQGQTICLTATATGSAGNDYVDVDISTATGYADVSGLISSADLKSTMPVINGTTDRHSITGTDATSATVTRVYLSGNIVDEDFTIQAYYCA